MEGWERIQYVINNEGLNKNSFSKAIGLNNNVTITRIINEKRNPSRNTCKKIVERFPKYNMGWLLTGEGDSLTSTYSNNKVTVNGNENVSNIGGQHINVSMPESGTPKIIKPDGSVEIQSLSSSAGTGLNDTDRLNQRIQDLERIILEKDATIKSKDETIWALRTMLDRQ